MENNSKTKSSHGQLLDAGNTINLAPTTVESKDILQ
jgi:hypothetical protein